MPRFQLTLYCSELFYHRATVVVEAPTADAAKEFILDGDPAEVMTEHGKETGSDGFDNFGVDEEVEELEEVDDEPDYTVPDVDLAARG